MNKKLLTLILISFLISGCAAGENILDNVINNASDRFTSTVNESIDGMFSGENENGVIANAQKIDFMQACREYRSNQARYQQNYTGKYVSFTGRITYLTSYRMYLVIDEYNKVDFIMGDGSDRPAGMDNKIINLSVGDTVEFQGYLSNHADTLRGGGCDFKIRAFLEK